MTMFKPGDLVSVTFTDEHKQKAKKVGLVLTVPLHPNWLVSPKKPDVWLFQRVLVDGSIISIWADHLEAFKP